LWVRSIGAVTDGEFASWLERYREVHELARTRSQQLAVLYDLTQASALSAQQRRMQADWIRQYEPLGRAVTLGVAFVTASAVIRGVLTAIFWVRPPYASHHVCAQLDEGLDWLFEHCEQRGVRIDSVMRAKVRRGLGTTGLNSVHKPPRASSCVTRLAVFARMTLRVAMRTRCRFHASRSARSSQASAKKPAPASLRT
jgi:hypothetical protein